MNQFQIALGKVDDIVDEFTELRSHGCSVFELIEDTSTLQQEECIVCCLECGNLYKEIVVEELGGVTVVRLRPGESYNGISFELVEALYYGGDREGEHNILEVLERLREVIATIEHSDATEVDHLDAERIAKLVLKKYMENNEDRVVPGPYIGPSPCIPPRYMPRMGNFDVNPPIPTGVELNINEPPPIEGPVGQHKSMTFTLQCDTDNKQRFWVFAGDEHYPLGGMNDLKSTHDTMEAARRAAVAQVEEYEIKGCAWCHIYDSHTDDIIEWSFEHGFAKRG